MLRKSIQFITTGGEVNVDCAATSCDNQSLDTTISRLLLTLQPDVDTAKACTAVVLISPLHHPEWVKIPCNKTYTSMDIWCNLNRGNTLNHSDIPLQFHLAKSRGCIHKGSILLGENCLFIVRISERIDWS